MGKLKGEYLHGFDDIKVGHVKLRVLGGVEVLASNHDALLRDVSAVRTPKRTLTPLVPSTQPRIQAVNESLASSKANHTLSRTYLEEVRQNLLSCLLRDQHLFVLIKDNYNELTVSKLVAW